MLVLIADIGGTNARLQLARLTGQRLHVVSRKDFISEAYAGVLPLIQAFLSANAGHGAVELACFAVAGPVHHNAVAFTNLPWTISGDALQRQFGFKTVHLVNDVEAAAYGLAALSADDYRVIKTGQSHRHSEEGIEKRIEEGTEEGIKAIVNIGTGFGQAMIQQHNHQLNVFASEGGHVAFSPADDAALQLQNHLMSQQPFVSVETVLSAAGLIRLFNYLALCRSTDEIAPTETAPSAQTTQQIIDWANQGEAIAIDSIQWFLQLLANQLANIALSYMATGGIYIVGGLLPAMLNQLSAQQFADHFANRRPFSDLLQTIAIKLVTNKDIGLLGAGVIAQQLNAATR